MREPRRIPTRMSPEIAVRSIDPSTTASRRISPETVFRATERNASRIQTSPDTSCPLTSPRARCSARSPEAVCTRVVPCTSSRLTSPLAVLIRASPLISPMLMSRDAVLISLDPKTPRARTSADFVLRSSSASGGQATRNRKSGPRPNEMKKPERVADTSTTTSWPMPRSCSSMRVCGSSSRAASVRASSSTCVVSPGAVSISITPAGMARLSSSRPGVWYVSDSIGAPFRERGDGSTAGRRGSARGGSGSFGGACGTAGRRWAARLRRRSSTSGGGTAERESGCWTLGVLSALAVAGHAPATGAAAFRARAPRDLLQEPGVGRDTGFLGGGVDDRLQRLGKPERDASAQRVLARRAGAAALLDVDELRVTAGEAHLDVPVRQLAGDLDRGLAEDVHQAEPEGWLQRRSDPASGISRRFIAHPGDGGKILLERLDEGRDVHARQYDITVMSCQAIYDAELCHRDAIVALRSGFRPTATTAAAPARAGIARQTPATRTPNAPASAPSTRLANGRSPRKATLQSAITRPRWVSSTSSWSRL